VLCELKEFLFLNKFTCLDACTDCLPCPQNSTDNNLPDDGTQNKKAADAYKILKDINKIFGWEEFSCSSIETEVVSNLINTAPASTLHTQVATIAEAMTMEYKEKTPEETEAQRKEITRLLNKRLSGYKAKLQRIYEDSNKNPIVEKALLVFGEEHLAEKINGILNELLNNQNPPDGNQLLQQSQRNELCKILIWLYIDRTVFGENDTSKLPLIADGLNKLRQSNFDMSKLFTEWKPEAFAKYERAEDMEAVRKIILNS